jgi:predicted metal-dependent enzyme (double-stranded beta helix superfamily)
MPHAAIANLAADIKALLATTTNAGEITARVAELAKPLAADKSWIEPRCHETDDEQGIGIVILHREPDDGLLIETVCWQAGRGVAPHDHCTWGVVIGLEGEETNVTWRRLDDGSRSGFAELEKAEEMTVRNGDVCRLLPTDIHSVRNDGGTDSMSLHIYGNDLATTGRSEYDPINKIQRPCPVRKKQ